MKQIPSFYQACHPICPLRKRRFLANRRTDLALLMLFPAGDFDVFCFLLAGFSCTPLDPPLSFCTLSICTNLRQSETAIIFSLSNQHQHLSHVHTVRLSLRLHEHLNIVSVECGYVTMVMLLWLCTGGGGSCGTQSYDSY